MNENSVRLLFGNAEPEIYNNRAKLAQELQKICNDGIAFLHVASGKCVTRPEIKILGDCQIFVKHFSATDGICYHNFIFEEIKHERMSFSNSF